LSSAILNRLPAAGLRDCSMPSTKSPTDVFIGFGDRLRWTRQALRSTQTRLAADLGVSAPRYNQWEKGKYVPDLMTLYRYKLVHGVSIDWILAGDPSGLPARILQQLIGIAIGPTAPPELVAIRDWLRGSSIHAQNMEAPPELPKPYTVHERGPKPLR